MNKILFVLTHYHPYIGGSEVVFKRLAEGLAKNGHKVSVITTRLENTLEEEEINGVMIRRINIPKIAYQFLFTFFSFFAVLDQVRKNDIIHTSSNYSALVAFITAKLCRKPIILTCHEVLGERWQKAEVFPKNIIFQIIEWFVIHLPYDHYIAVSNATKIDLINAGIQPEKITTALWGLDDIFLSKKYKSEGKLRKLLDIQDTTFLYGYFGRPGATKGVENLIKAVPDIAKKIPDSKLILILAREPRKRYNKILKLISQINADQYVRIVPSFDDRDRLFQHLCDLNCIVIPSITEGFGLTTIEACELGLNVVATMVGPIPDLIFGKYLLVLPSSPEEICKALIQIRAGKCIQREKPLHITWDNTIDIYQKVYWSMN